MAYKWKPSKTAKREFAQRMQDPAEAAAYEQRKKDRADKKRAGSKFDYQTAGGMYTPTQQQYNEAIRLMASIAGTERTREASELEQAAQMVMYGYSCQEKVHHDYIHIINEFSRNTPQS